MKEQIVNMFGKRNIYLTAESKKCFIGREILFCEPFKPGILRVHTKRGNKFEYVFSDFKHIPRGIGARQ